MSIIPIPCKRHPGWVEIPGYSGYAANAKGMILNKRTGYATKGGMAGRYLKVSVYRDGDEKAILQYVHILVCLAYHGLPELGQVVKHENDRRLDNKPLNLSWGSQSDNIKDTYVRGLRKPTYGPRISKEDHEEETTYVVGDHKFTQSELNEIKDQIPVEYRSLKFLSRFDICPGEQYVEGADLEDPLTLYRDEASALTLVDGAGRLALHRREETEHVPCQTISFTFLAQYGFEINADSVSIENHKKTEATTPWYKW